MALALSRIGLHLLFFLRFIQLGSVTITGFIYCYLVWHHNNHYCVYFPSSCSALEMSYINVPWEYKFVISACTLAFLESFISTTVLLHMKRMPNYRRLLFTTTPVAIVFGLACRAIFTNPALSMYCYFNYIPQSLKSNVEKKNCVMVVDGYVALSIAVGFTGFIFLMSAITAVSQLIRKKRIMLPTETSASEPTNVEGEKLISV